ncbi:MAG: uroporphyrinogen-III C-methyltransferase [Zetaproteobacteria bacterium CG12_big_fil_rev_8_21_14_0_65_54_13]|nr:MAG: uroporphyrinogen-III C-methyltransferase [Zetaproteobacteria bacterium CG23_combo_of_CG06-09_8_20_14_all_54_7]PIW50016.1 MAG: uroporphyrinogen-III C-methyltransferase [Zetaproteobacteria bacterium CG12_big_fil_rev_8_21_14_0_65_54_13]PIX54642.1 MAG: uroporphyrinogen-III C-methyltransferase [Zetaproteobacteria bacterium CG_4_10_14_3_um_filter_54_28]PJA30736.1 MAG: uroporphyrinogen-III C-methyltransferase [Zetaproteobacteria bacterium CG_4_9_14_3_um_filter_54_145]
MKLDAPLRAGEVALVGAGPGAASLLTLAAASLIADCDVIVHDALVSDEVLAMAADSAEIIAAGKRGGRPSASQDDICDLLIELAQAGKRVVRLKGGDPFVFGRGGEEVRALAKLGIAFRIIPGITAGVAAPAMAGIPVTDRSVNATLAFLTGHEANDDSRMDWPALVRAFPVLVFYMGARNLERIASCLLKAGLDAQTAVAIIHAATTDHEQTTIGSLQAAAAGQLQAQSPAIVIIGDVVASRTIWRDEF